MKPLKEDLSNWNWQHTLYLSSYILIRIFQVWNLNTNVLKFNKFCGFIGERVIASGLHSRSRFKTMWYKVSTCET
ncbi:hypothetical protein NPIL_260571 [Nephila pilipes]|uniref:Uncharacterized protein n=1 Tax=Nephila pilipes TaxID=299642 RepID=A0A8X6PEL9_NEPPI|nr:hypothetical protein NPIL_260571 [Nephila pilipes]